MKKMFYRSPQGDNAGGTAIAEEEKKDPASVATTEESKVEKTAGSLEELLKQPDLVDSLEGDSLDNTTTKGKEPASTGTAAEGDKKKKVPEAITGKKKEDNVEATSASTTEKKDETDDSFTIEPLAITGDEEVATSWKGLGKDLLGKELEEDDFDVFKSKLTESLTEERTAGIEEGKKLAATLDLEKFTPAARDVIEFLNTPGNTIESYTAPLKVYDDYIKMESTELIKEDLKAKKWDETAIDNHVKQLKEDGKIDSEAYAIRKTLENAKENEAARLVVVARQKQDQIKNNIQQEKQREDTAITEALSKLGPLLGGTLSTSAIKTIEQKWKAGEYRERFKKDPAFVARLIAFAEFGDSAETELRKKITTQKNESLRRNLSNIDVLPGGGTGGRQEASKESGETDPWKAWETGFADSQKKK